MLYTANNTCGTRFYERLFRFMKNTNSIMVLARCRVLEKLSVTVGFRVVSDIRDERRRSDNEKYKTEFI